MIIKGKQFKLIQVISLALYYGIAYWLPQSNTGVLMMGQISKKIRYLLCKQIFKKCGNNVNIERKAKFGRGTDICIGDNSGIGINALVPSDIQIGDNVMMGPNCYILLSNHSFTDLTVPMVNQGHLPRKQTHIGNDVWIGRNVTMTPGRTIADGTIIGACCLLCKDFPEYSIVGGNPSILIRHRK